MNLRDAIEGRVLMKYLKRPWCLLDGSSWSAGQEGQMDVVTRRHAMPARSQAPHLQQVGYTSRCCFSIGIIYGFSPNKSIMETAKAAQPIHSLIEFQFFSSADITLFRSLGVGLGLWITLLVLQHDQH